MPPVSSLLSESVRLQSGSPGPAAAIRLPRPAPSFLPFQASLPFRCGLLAALLPFTAILTGCSKKESRGAGAGGGKGGGGGGGRGPVPVLAVQALKQDVPLLLPAIGSVQPHATVTVRPQISGKLAGIHFEEGGFVKQGDLLFTIDTRPFEVALAQAKAALDQARAEATNASAQEKRYNELDRSGSVSAEVTEQIRTASLTAAAKVTAAGAAVQQAELELDYCRITAPLSGRTGRLLLDPGNIVQANLTDLAIINEVQPAEVSFTLAGRHLSLLREHTAAGQPLQVTVTPEGTASEEAGQVSFYDNTVRSATGTIEVRALFPNEKQLLWPGQFLDVRLRLTQTKDAVTIPSKAIQTGQKGPFVFVIRPDSTAEMRGIVPDRVAGGDTLIREGLQAGETVIIDGQSLVSPNAKVEIKTGLAANAPAAPHPAPAPPPPASSPGTTPKPT